MGAVTIERVEGKAGLRRFFAVTPPLYADDPCWVQPLTFERLMHLDPARNPFLKEMEIVWLVARRDGRDVGRITAQIDGKHLAAYRDGVGHFGFLEAEDDPEVFQALTGAAEAWLRERGMTKATGPFDPSINDECGLLIEGFDRIPSMMMGHHRAYYRPRLEEAGWTKAKDLVCYWFDVQRPWPEAAQKFFERVGRRSDLVVRPLDMKSYAREIRTICNIFNDAWAGNWGFVPFGEAEAQYLAASIKPVVRADDFAIAELDGEPVAFCLVLPNVNLAIRDLGGSLFPFGWAKLLWRLKVSGIEEWRMPLMGVRQRHQSSVVGAALSMAVIKQIQAWHRARGTKAAELSWILEENKRLHSILALIGSEPYKTYRIFEKALV